MLFDDTFQTIAGPAEGFFKDKGSKFLAYAFPVENDLQAKSHLAELYELHPKAVHHCYAYRLGADRMSYRMSDDGEPSGSAGKPILGQIDSKGLTDAGIIVVRYFGGTLLGIPGLIKAYKTVSALVLQTIPVIQKQVEVPVLLNFEYARTGEIKALLKQTGASIIEQEILLFPFIKAGIPSTRMEEFISKIKNLDNVSVKKLVTL